MGYSTKKQRPQRKGASNRAALEESKFFRKANNELTEIIESRIRENENLAKQIEALKDYAHALELCLGESQLCEYCPSSGIDFEHDDIHCTVDFDGLRKKAGMDA